MFESQGKVVPAKAPVQLSLAPALGAGSAGPGGAAAGAGAGAGGPEAGHKGQGQYHQHHGDLVLEEGSVGGEDNMAFKLLMKRGGKDDRSREIMVRGVWGSVAVKHENMWEWMKASGRAARRAPGSF